MSKRKPIPKKPLPKMDTLLGGSSPAPSEVEVQQDKIRQAPTIENTQKEEKVKVSFYIDSTLAERLGYAQVRLKSLTGKKGHRVSRSAIIETALAVLLEDLDERQNDSLLAKNI